MGVTQRSPIALLAWSPGHSQYKPDELIYSDPSHVFAQDAVCVNHWSLS